MPKTKNEYLMWNINTRTLYDGTGVNIDVYYSIIRFIHQAWALRNFMFNHTFNLSLYIPGKADMTF